MSNFFSKYYARLNAKNDSIAIGDASTGTTLVVNPDGSINVVGTGSGGSILVTQGTIPWIDNISQFGGNNVVTGTGTSGPGIPRVTVSNDSNILATQSGTWNIATLTSITNPVTVNQGTSPWLTSRNWTLSNTTDSVNIGNFPSSFIVNQGTSPWIIAGTVTANAGTGTFLVDGSAHTQPVSGNLGRTWTLNSATDSVTASVTVPGTVSVTQGTTPWTDNVTQFGGNNVVTGTGISGLGIPRVTISNDSNILATQSGTWNIATLTSITNPVTVNQGTSPWVISGSTTVTGTVTANQGTSPWVISGTVSASNFPTTVDVNYGTVGANTLRSAAQIGNATGAAAFGAGSTTAQVLRVVLPTDQTPIPVTQSGSWTTLVTQGTSPWVVSGTVLVSNLPATVDTNYGTVGANTLRSAAQIGNSTGAALFGAGTTTAQVLRVVLPTDQTSIPVTQSGTWTTGRTWTLASGTDSIASVQSGTWNIATLTSITNPVTVAQATAANLNATVVGTGTFAVQATQAGTWNVTTTGTGSTRTTYGVAATFTAAVSSTDVFTITGSATKTIKIVEIGVSGTNTGNTNVLVNLVKRSTANTGGTSTTPTIVPFDSADAAATGVVRAYTANPTTGTLVGTIRSDYAFFPTLASTNQGTTIDHEFGIYNDKPIYLRGTSEVLAINLGGTLITGTTSLSVDITWTEE